MTLIDSARSAVHPWFSLDAEAEQDDFERLPQQRIEICLMCPHCAAACDKCDGDGNLRGERGRPRKEIDVVLLREMMRLRKCNSAMCAALGVSKRTLNRAKNMILKGELS